MSGFPELPPLPLPLPPAGEPSRRDPSAASGVARPAMSPEGSPAGGRKSAKSAKSATLSATRPADSPAAAAQLPIAIPPVSPATAASFAAFEAVVGGRAQLCAKLALVAQSRDDEYVVGLLADPRYDHEPLAGLCRIGKISLKRLMELYRDAALVSSQVRSIERVADRLPAVAEDVMARATEHRVTCGTCQGACTITVQDPPEKKGDEPPPPRQVACPACRGYGSVIEQPDHEVQKTALEIGGLLARGKGGLTIQQTQVNANLAASGGANFGELMEKLDGVLFGDARSRVSRAPQTDFVEATVVEPAESPAEPPPEPPLAEEGAA